MREVKLMISGTFNSDEPVKRSRTPIIPAMKKATTPIIPVFEDDDNSFIYMIQDESAYANCVART